MGHEAQHRSRDTARHAVAAQPEHASNTTRCTGGCPVRIASRDAADRPTQLSLGPFQTIVPRPATGQRFPSNRPVDGESGTHDNRVVVDLLAPLPSVTEDRQHWAFRRLVEADKYAPARDMLRDVWATFPNPDPHFIREFQTKGFDARIWELVLGAVGRFGPYRVSRPHETPDFLFERDGMGVWIEATTANAKPRQNVEKPEDELEAKFHELNNIIPIRLGSPLYSKLTKADWNLTHAAGHPFAIAIEDFSDDDPIRTSDAPLVRYLYGVEHKVVSLPGESVRIEFAKVPSHKHGTKEIPSGFFDLPGAENVSAVIFSNEGTLMKFNRMGFNFQSYPGVRMVRVGFTVDFDPSATAPATFGYLVGDFYEEWGHGMMVYHNPNAIHPIPIGFFEGFSGIHWIEDGQYENLFRDFSPHSSVTVTYQTRGSERKLSVLDRILRKEARRKASELAAIAEGAELLAWRDKFVG